MKTQRKQTVTLSETETLLMLKVGAAESRIDWCEECSAEVIWFDLPAAVELLEMPSVSARRVIHFDGKRVCSRSFFNTLWGGR